MNKYLLIFSAIATVMLTSCAYHMGSPLTGKYNSMAIGDVSNGTKEANLTYLVKNAMSDQIMQEPGLALTSENNAQLVLDLKVTDNSISTAATSILRERKEVRHRKTTSVTIMRRVSLDVEYALFEGNSSEKPILNGTVTGEAFLPVMHDQEVALEPAFREAALDATKQIMNVLAEFPEFSENAN